MTKLCVNCQHHFIEYTNFVDHITHNCNNPKYFSRAYIDPVDGNERNDSDRCYRMRDSHGSCGPDGNGYEPKMTVKFFNWIKSFFKS